MLKNSPTKPKSENDSILYNRVKEKALSFFKERQLDSFKKYSWKTSRIAQTDEQLQEVHFYKATYYKYSEKPDSAYYHYHQSRNILLHIKRYRYCRKKNV